MTNEYVGMQVIATLFLIGFSACLGIRNRHLGFGTLGLAEILQRFDERRQSPIGHMVRKPRLIHHARSRIRLLLWSLAPVSITVTLLLFLWWSDRYVLVPILAVPFCAALFYAFWWIQRQAVPAYQDGYDEYLRLTEPKNCWLEGRINESSRSYLAQGGRVIAAEVRDNAGRSRTLRFFVSYRVDGRYRLSHLMPDCGVVRFIYAPVFVIGDELVPALLDGTTVHGELVGVERLTAPVVEPLSRDEYERRQGEREFRSAGIAQ